MTFTIQKPDLCHFFVNISYSTLVDSKNLYQLNLTLMTYEY